MQGRLTPQNGRGIQFFPFDNWENEFEYSSELGISHIDFIFDLENYKNNPLWSDEGIEKINNLKNKYNVEVNYICADYFMRNPFFRVSEDIKKENINILNKLIKIAHKIGATCIEIPLVDNSSIKSDKEKNEFIESIKNCLPMAEKYSIFIGLESDLPPKELLDLVTKINNKFIKIIYDTGNSSGLGYNTYEEVKTFGEYIYNVHIKDRVLGGETVELETGSADFPQTFKALQEIGYKNNFTLQAARSEDGGEKENIKKQSQLLKKYINEYLK